MRLMSKGEYVIVPKGTKFTGAGKLGLIARTISREKNKNKKNNNNQGLYQILRQTIIKYFEVTCDIFVFKNNFNMISFTDRERRVIASCLKMFVHASTTKVWMVVCQSRLKPSPTSAEKGNTVNTWQAGVVLSTSPPPTSQYSLGKAV